MTAVQWIRGEILEIDGQEFRVTGRAANGLVNLEHAHDGYARTETDDALVEMWSERRVIRRTHSPEITKFDDRYGRTPKPMEADFELLPLRTREATQRRMAYVMAVWERDPKSHSQKALAPIIAEVAATLNDPNPPQYETLASWCRTYRRSGFGARVNPQVLAPQTHRCGNRKQRFDDEVLGVMDHLVDRDYLRPRPNHVTYIHGELTRLVAKMRPDGKPVAYLTSDRKHLRVPSLTTFRQHIKRLDRDLVMRKQHGRIIERRHCDPVIKGPTGDWPGHEYEIDHTLCDIIVKDFERKIVLGRPWLTLVLCRRTRAIVGFHISFHAPSAHTVAMALRMAILPKDKLLVKYGIQGKWNCHGTPGTVVVDNGPEFHSEDFESACFSIGTVIVYCRVKTPQEKGKIERLFRRLNNDFFRRLPGYSFSSLKERGNYDAEADSLVNLKDLITGFLNYVVNDYMVAPHASLETSPAQEWDEGVKKHPVRLLDDVNQLDALFTLGESRALTRKGIELDGLIYSTKDAEFKAIINRSDKPASVRVRRDINDLSYIQVQDWRYGTWFSVPSVDPEYTTGLTLDRHGLISARARMRKKAYKRLTINDLLQARHELDLMVENLRKEGKMTKRLAAKLGDEERLAGIEPLNVAKAASVDFTEVTPVTPKAAKPEPLPHHYKRDPSAAEIASQAASMGITAD